jgi:hypothetical protein
MTELSPAANAILDAAYRRMDNNPHNEVEATLAAALRAVADQVVPTEMDLPPIAPDLGHFRQHERRLTRQRLLAIADELEAGQ